MITKENIQEIATEKQLHMHVVEKDYVLGWVLAPSFSTSILEKIRFAAANRLLIKLGYDGDTRLIEPYSLARSSEGNLLLCAIKHQTREPRRYRMDRIESISIMEKSFTPKYGVEITSAGYLVNIEKNTILSFVNEPEVICKVVDDISIEFENEIMSLSKRAGIVLEKKGKSDNVAGTAYWTYNGQTLWDLRNEMED